MKKSEALKTLGLADGATDDEVKQAHRKLVIAHHPDKFALDSPERAEAEELAADEVARPGTSEHQLGLAVDIISNAHPDLDEGWAETEEAVWLKEHCAEYGFILRYPPDKSDITGIVWEPWHFRYVGEEAAVYIMENDLCLEEYLAAPQV